MQWRVWLARAFRIVSIVGLVACFTGLVGGVYLLHGLPRQPVQSTGHVMRISLHGTHIYATAMHYWVAMQLPTYGAAVFFLGKFGTLLLKRQ